MKVAGVGLGVDLVGKSLREVRPLLGRLVSTLWGLPEVVLLYRDVGRVYDICRWGAV